MKDIKGYLNRIGFSKKVFAEEINLSRPTLDTYIRKYEKDGELPKERYQIVFDRLFKVELSQEEFQNRLVFIKKLLERDKRLGTEKLDALAADFVSILKDRMTNDMILGDWNKSVYQFIDMMISSYREEKVFEKLAEYFCFLNGKLEEESLDEEQKMYLAYYYDVFDKIRRNRIGFDKAAYKRLLERRKEIKILNKRKKDNTKKEVSRIIHNSIEELESMGLEVTQEEIIKSVLDKAKELNLPQK